MMRPPSPSRLRFDTSIARRANLSLRTAAAALLTVALSTACVTQGTNDQAEPERDPPIASIVSPADDALFTWFDDTVDGTGNTITFIGVGTSPDDGLLTGAALQWSTRPTFGATQEWTDAGSGVTVDVFFAWASCSIQTYEVRLVVTDAEGLTDTTIHSVAVQPPPC